MKLILSVLLIFIVSINSRKLSFKRSSSIPSVIKSFTEEFLLRKEIFDFEILLSCKSIETKWKLYDIVKGIKSEKFAIEVKFVKNVENYQSDIKKSMIVLFCSNYELNNFLSFQKVKPKFAKVVKLLLYSIDEIKIFKNFENFKNESEFLLPLHHAFFINDTKKSIELFTTQFDTKEKCGRRQKVSVNDFNKKSQRWKRKFEIYEKFRNFHGCSKIFNFAYGTHMKYKITDRKLSKESQLKEITKLYSSNAEFTSTYYDMLEIIASKVNFKPFFRLRVIDFDPRTKTSVVHKIPYKGNILQYHETIDEASYEINVGRPFHMSNAFKQTVFTFVVTPGEPYTPYEKLLLPFDELTWTFLLLTFVTGFIVIFFVNFMPKIIHETLYGHGVTNPMVNLVAIFFGIGQTKLPTNNFARIILTFFLAFCLVIRTAYQGKLSKIKFEFFRKI